MKKVAVIGAKGMLGIDVVEAMKESGYEVIEYDVDNLDITKLSEVENLKESQAEIVINCAAYTDVNGAEDHKELAFEVNAYGPEYLAMVTRDMNIPIIHISTDYVFNGSVAQGYSEESQEFGPQNVYGKSKLEGEKRLTKINPRHYLIRISWLFGSHGKNFISTMIKLATERETVTVVNDQFGNPTYTKDLSKAIVELIGSEAEYGVYHLTNSTPDDKGISWYDLADCGIKAKGLKTNVMPVTSEAFPQKAKRPKYSTLLNTKQPKLRPYEEAVIEYVQTISV